MVLAATATVRAAEWVLAVNLLAAVVLAGLAAAGAVTWRDVLLAPFGYLSRLRLAPGYLVGGLRRAPGPGRRGRLVPALRAGVVAVALLAVFGALFVSADRAFAELAERVFIPTSLGSLPVRVVVFLVAAAVIATLAVARFRDPGTPFVRESQWLPDPQLRPRLGRLEWTTALVALDLLFAAFVAVQVAVLFGGHDHVLRTAGLTYAEYAREGFFQLLVVGLLTLGVVGAAARFGRVESERDARRMQVLAGTLCLLTLVVLASAVHRLGLYEEAFGFTQERLTVHAVIWWIGALFVLVMIAGPGAGRRGCRAPR